MKQLLIIGLSVFFLSACKKKIDELPPATQTGANTLGAKVNGEFWIPQGFGPFPANDILEARIFPNNDLTIKAQNFSKSPTETEFELFITNVAAPGVYPLNTAVSYPRMTASYGYFVKRVLTPSDEWITTTTATGTVTITRIDRVNMIVSGTFELNPASLYNSGQTLSITEGRFDLKLQ